MIFSLQITKKCSFILLVFLIGYVNCTFNLRASTLNFSELPFYENDPDSYSIYLADKTRVNHGAVETSNISNVYITYVNEYRTYFRSNLFKKDKAIFSQNPPKNAKKWIKLSPTPDNTGLVARLMTPYSSSAENFLERISVHHSADNSDKQLLEKDHISNKDPFSFIGGMIIFPQTNRYATILTFGNAWKTLLNPYIIVPRWGLRIVASHGFCDPQQIREISAQYFRNPIPSKRKERSAAVEDISRFGIEVASEGIESLRVRPASSYGTKRIVKGADYLNFCVTKRDKSNTGTSFESLKQVSTYFFNLSIQGSFSIHPNLKCFVDDEVREDGLIRTLSKQLLILIRTKEAKYSLFLHDWIWSLFDTKTLRFGEEKKSSEIFDHLSSIETLNSTIKVSTLKGDHSSNEPVGKLFYSLPLEHKDHFYRYDRGAWFHVDASRFNAIKTVMRSFKRSSQDLGLPEYCLDDLMGDRKNYAELCYNKKAVAHLNSLGHRAFLIDRLNIPLENGRGHIFEFGDIFLIKNGKYFIIHVKRADASDLSHLREQVERSADYLVSTLNRKINSSFFLEASIKDLLHKHDLELPKNYEGPFQKMLRGRHQNNRRLEILLDQPILVVNQEQAFKRLMRRILDETKSTDLFNQHIDAFCEALDILWLCVQVGKINLDQNKSEIRSFIKRARLAIEGGTAIFSNGLLKKSEQKKITFVLAVVDDRGVKRFVDTEIKKEDKRLERSQAKKAVLDRFRNDDKRLSIVGENDKTTPLFKNQDLWGLDRTRMTVQRQGFHFSLVVTNENADETWDAFGSKGETAEIKEEICEVKAEESLGIEPIEILFPKGTHDKVKNKCNKIVSHMRKYPNKKYTKKEIEDNKDLQTGSAKTALDKLVELKVITEEKHGRSYQYSLNDAYKISSQKGSI